MKIDILGVKVDKVTMAEAVDQIIGWVKKGGKHYIVTPNVEIIMMAQIDPEFKKILNQADLAIPDSSRLGWAHEILNQKSIIEKILTWPFFVAPNILVRGFDTVAGVDLMEELIKEAADKGFTVGLLGGEEGVAEKAAECLIQKYPKLKISFTSTGGKVSKDGNQESQYTIYDIPYTDILFVAFGHGKQEKWIAKNLAKNDVGVMMAVGGSLDYLSGNMVRAPISLRRIGLEWLFRLILQPWRIKRLPALVKFVIQVLKY